MADQKISALTTNPGIDGTEEVPTARSGSNFKNTFTALKTWLQGVLNFSGLVDTYALSTAPNASVPVLNAAKTALIPLQLLDSPIEVDVYVGSALAGTWNYANGASGVGATLTRTTNGALATTDGVTSIVGRTYLHNQWTGANRLRNGPYELTQVGSAGTPAIFTRLTNSDSTAELNDQAVIIALGSATNRGKVYVQTTSAPTVGTSIIVYQTSTVAAPSVAPTSITVAAAQALVAAGTVVVGRVYSITDSSAVKNAADRIIIKGSTADAFEQVGVYIDTVNNQRNEILYRIDDSPTDEIIYWKDNFGNEIWDTVGLGTIAAFDFGNNLWTGNKSTTGFTLAGTPTQLIGNFFQEDVTISAPSNNGNVNNNKLGQTSTIIVDGGEILNCIVGTSSSVTSTGKIQNCIIGDGCSIDDGGFDLTGLIFPSGTSYTAGSDLTNAVFTANGFRCGGDFLIAEGLFRTFNTKALSMLVSANANLTMTVSGTGSITLAGLNDYANNAAAVGAGKAVGDLYYTNTAGEATLKIVI